MVLNRYQIPLQLRIYTYMYIYNRIVWFPPGNAMNEGSVDKLDQ